LPNFPDKSISVIKSHEDPGPRTCGHKKNGGDHLL
jgi:hypothetical protein